MPKVEAPFVDAKVDTNDLSGSGKSVIYGVGGIALLWMVIQYGQVAGDKLTATVDNLTGVNASGSSDGITFDGAP